MCFPVLTIVKMCTLRKPVIGRPSWKLIKKRYCSSWHARCGFTILSVHWDIGTERASRLVRIPNIWESQMVKVLREKSLLCRKVGTMWAVEDFSFSTCSRKVSEVRKTWFGSDFIKWDPYMWVNFYSKCKSARCEGKVDWSCSGLRAKSWEESPHFSKLAPQGFRGGKVRDVFIYLWFNLKS